MCESLETTSEVTEDQDKMNKFHQQNKLVESRWLGMHRKVRFYNSGELTGIAHHFYPLCSSSTCTGE